MAYGTLALDTITTSTGQTIGASSASTMKNRIINGDMRIDQRYSGSATANTINGYTVDRWNMAQSVTGKVIVQQLSATPPPGFSNYLGITSQSAYSIGATDIFQLYQSIEGYNIADIGWGTTNAKTVTVSFWVQSSLTGTFGGALNNAAGRYPFSYTINQGNTWEYKTITIAGSTTLGNANITNGGGMSLIFSLGIGSTYSGTAGTWSATNYLSATGATSVVGTSGATWYVTGVQLEVGAAATTFDYRQYGTEFGLCQRYYQRIDVAGGGAWNGSAYAIIGFTFPMPMRTTPTASWNSGGLAGNGSTDWSVTSLPSFIQNSASGGVLLYQATGATSGATTGAYIRAANTSFSAEL
jgi:hypothetical protein